jgi:hypothetical protein
VPRPAKPIRLQLSRKKGFRLDAASHAANGLPAVRVCRPGRWGNPYRIGIDGTTTGCVRLFRKSITPAQRAQAREVSGRVKEREKARHLTVPRLFVTSAKSAAIV